MTGSDHDSDRTKVHPVVRAAAEWAWRLLLLVAAVYVFFKILREYSEVTVPVALAILVAAFLVPFVDWMDRHGLPRSVAVIVALVVSAGVVAGVLTFVVEQFIDGLPGLTSEVTSTINSIRDWLVNGPLHFREAQIGNISEDFTDFLNKNQDKVTNGAIATATRVTEIATGALMTVFLVIFFTYGGGKIWDFCTNLVPRGSRERVRNAGRAGFGSLVGYVRATIIVALVDAVGIGTGLAILGVPLALPLASLVFIGAFIPIVGALVTGTLAVLVALITKGFLAAVIATAVVIGVMQLESHVLQPFVMGRSVRVHPVAVILAIAAGVVTAGIVGGLLAVPLVAFCNTFVRSVRAQLDAEQGIPDREESDESDDSDGPFDDVPADEPMWDDPDAPGVHGNVYPHDKDDRADSDDRAGKDDRADSDDRAGKDGRDSDD
ncbi:AI-2E family transporter [Gordonia jinhuaensis]|nr:AI-2E family transporter [Gordonia jinhuaensis]